MDNERQVVKEYQITANEWNKIDLSTVKYKAERFLIESIILMLIEEQLQNIGIYEYVVKYDSIYLFQNIEIDVNKLFINAINKYNKEIKQ